MGLLFPQVRLLSQKKNDLDQSNECGSELHFATMALWIFLQMQLRLLEPGPV
jgi:hypothetical protein